MSMSISMSISLCIYLCLSISTSTSTSFSVSISISLSISISFYIYVSIYICIYLSIYLPIYLSIFLSIYLSILLSFPFLSFLSFPFLSFPILSYLSKGFALSLRWYSNPKPTLNQARIYSTPTLYKEILHQHDDNIQWNYCASLRLNLHSTCFQGVVYTPWVSHSTQHLACENRCFQSALGQPSRFFQI